MLGVVHGKTYDAEAYRSRDQDIELGHLFERLWSTRGLYGLGSSMPGLVCSNPCLGLKSEPSVLDRCYMQIEKNPEFAIRYWAADVGSVACRDNVHITGISRFCVHRPVLTYTSVDIFHGQHPRTLLRLHRA